MLQTINTFDLPMPHSVVIAQRQQEDEELFSGMGTRIPAPNWIDDGAAEWAAALPVALLKQTRKKHHKRANEKLTNAREQLIARGFSEIDIELARLDDEGLLMLASAQAASARAADGYSRNEPHGRPEHDRRFNMKRLRAMRAEVIANLEIALKLIGIDKGRSLYAGDESKRLRDEANKRTAEYLATATVVIPVKDANGKITGEKLIPLADCGNTRYKSLAEFIGFVTALSVRAQIEGRKATLVTTSAPAHMHPSSPFYDCQTTPRQANRYLSKTNKAARDTLRKWAVKEAGVGSKEPHGSAVPHSHLVIFHDAMKVAEARYKRLVEFVRRPFVFTKKGKLVKNPKLEEADLIPFKEAESQLLGSMVREEFIEGMARDIIECAFERHFLDLERDDYTGRLVHGVGVNFKHDAEKESNGASIVSYILTYSLKSFFINIDKLPKRTDFESDEDHKKANEAAIKQQVESGGDLPVRACMAAHGIRSREIWGMPSRSPFKALGKQHQKISDTEMEDMRQAILKKHDNDEDDKNKAHYEYLMAQGGLNAPRKMVKFRMQSKALQSNYALRPDMVRRRVLGVARYEIDPLSGSTEMIPAYLHKTRIEGCYITGGNGVAEAATKRSSAKAMTQITKTKAKAALQIAEAKAKAESTTRIGALIPNYPSSGASTAKIGTSPPPKSPITLH